MPPTLLSLHHVTATVDHAVADLRFCTGLLGLRLVKKTVNFDNHFVYHFYYGDERGTPSTIWTTFPYHGWGVPVGRKGAGQIVATAFAVPVGALGMWRDRCGASGVAARELPPRFGHRALGVDDPSGLVLELVEADGDARTPWHAPDLDAGAAIRGLHSVTLCVRAPDVTAAFLTEVLGLHQTGREGDRTRLAVGSPGPGHTVDLVEAGPAPDAVNGLGTVHHVALAIGTEDEQLALRAELVGRGLQVTEVRDRQYFKSIYFRVPGGVLFEVATIRPGFDVDEPLDRLGQGLKLPPWEEPHRAEISARLPVLA